MFVLSHSPPTAFPLPRQPLVRAHALRSGCRHSPARRRTVLVCAYRAWRVLVHAHTGAVRVLVGAKSGRVLVGAHRGRARALRRK